MSKITQQAKDRCAAHSLQEQLEQVRVVLGIRHSDRSDIDLMMDADEAWDSHRTRLVLPIDGAD